ncbi:MAG: hypothetical protein IPG07_11255 [Crocinitomicaceae bacterium]|jgi:hypothetical protein|nr:hypothetical protein [Crocinitomicaceae bacterium]
MSKNYLATKGWIVVAYYLGLIIILIGMQFLSGEYYLRNSNFLNFDASHYFHISENGYNDFRVAFFPLFPKIWDFLNLSAVSMSILNLCIYIFFLIYLGYQLQFSRTQLFYSVLIPSNIFFFLPYSEALFFAACVLVLVGILKEKNWITIFALIIASVARPAYVIFLPALFAVAYLGEGTFGSRLKRILIYSGAIFTGTFLVGLIQFNDTGRWFEFFEAQELWGNHLQFPTLPIRSWAGGFVTRLDGTALVVGVICWVLTSYWLYLKLVKKQKLEVPTSVVFSVFYLAGISLIVILFRGGSLFSLNRFVFCSPFFLVFIKYVSDNVVIRNQFKIAVYSFLLLTVYWLLFYSFVHLESFLKYAGLSVLLIAVAKLVTNKSLKTNLFNLVVIFILVEIQVYLLIRFLNGNWVA